MKQRTLAMMHGFEQYRKEDAASDVSRRDGAGGAVGAGLCALVEPYYRKVGNGRPPLGVERMLRIYFLQQSFNLSDLAVQEALYDSAALR